MNNTPRVAISEDFLTAFAVIPRAQQKKVTEFVTKFRHDPRSSGINYEKINDAGDKNFRSVRIDQDYRGVVLRPSEGNVHVLLWVAKHDEAYDWARRHQCRIHPDTGSLQLLNVTLLREQPEITGESKPEITAPLFSLRDRELARLGVPQELHEKVKHLATEDELEAMEENLPREAFEALYLHAAGTSLDEIMAEYGARDEPVDTNDFETALTNEQSRRRFYVVEGELELHEMLEAPLEKWRVFLHPSQRRLVERDWNGPVRVLGGAGTGKTVVAMHRARWLTANRVSGPGDKILFTTFTTNLAMDIEDNMRKICSASEMGRIEIINIDAWISRLLKRQNYPHTIVYDNNDKYRKAWELALQQTPVEPVLTDNFYREEWLRVILPQHIMDRDGYFRASRVGRGVPLTRKQRAAVWPVFEELRIQMHQEGLRTIEDATHDAIDIIQRNNITLPYQSVIIDEAQDMGSEVMTLLRKLVPAKENDIFIVGDGHQRIYRRRYTLSQYGIEIRGRGRKLRINYRTTEETRHMAVAVLENLPFDDLDGKDDSIGGYRSLLHGENPVIMNFKTMQEEGKWLINQIKEIDTELVDTCIVARTQTLLDEYEKLLGNSEIPVVRLSRRQPDNRTRPGVRLATMHRVKGLEFKYIFIVSVNNDIIPLKYIIESASDITEKTDSEMLERALFHVSMTRAIRKLWISFYGKPSKYL